jgi:hypothetical protein
VAQQSQSPARVVAVAAVQPVGASHQQQSSDVVEGKGCGLAAPVGETGQLPFGVVGIVDIEAAYKVTDKDIEALKQAGYSEDAIFEITISAAVGAAYARLERGLEILKGAK